MTARLIALGSILLLVGCAASEPSPRPEPAPAVSAGGEGQDRAPAQEGEALPSAGAVVEGELVWDEDDVEAGDESVPFPQAGPAAGAERERGDREDGEPIAGPAAGAIVGSGSGEELDPEGELPDTGPAPRLDDPEERADLEAAAALADAYDDDPEARAIAERAAALRRAIRARAASWLAARAPAALKDADGLARAFLPYLSPSAREALAQEADLAAALAREHGALVGDGLGVASAEVEAVELGFDHARVRARVRWEGGAEATFTTVWVLLAGEPYLKTASDFGEPLELTGLATDR